MWRLSCKDAVPQPQMNYVATAQTHMLRADETRTVHPPWSFQQALKPAIKNGLTGFFTIWLIQHACCSVRSDEGQLFELFEGVSFHSCPFLLVSQIGWRSTSAPVSNVLQRDCRHRVSRQGCVDVQLWISATHGVLHQGHEVTVQSHLTTAPSSISLLCLFLLTNYERDFLWVSFGNIFPLMALL